MDKKNSSKRRRIGSMSESIFLKELVKQVRALDTYGVWERMGDDELLTQKYIKTKEQLKEIPVIADISADQIKDIRLILQAIALAFEQKTYDMANVILEMSHEGFGRGVVIADKIVIADKYFKDAHRFGYPSIEKLIEEGDKMLEKAVSTYQEYKK
jgi:probable nitrogen fixation protein